MNKPPTLLASGRHHVILEDRAHDGLHIVRKADRADLWLQGDDADLLRAALDSAYAVADGGGNAVIADMKAAVDHVCEEYGVVLRLPRDRGEDAVRASAVSVLGRHHLDGLGRDDLEEAIVHALASARLDPNAVQDISEALWNGIVCSPAVRSFNSAEVDALVGRAARRMLQAGHQVVDLPSPAGDQARTDSVRVRLFRKQCGEGAAVSIEDLRFPSSDSRHHLCHSADIQGALDHCNGDLAPFAPRLAAVALAFDPESLTPAWQRDADARVRVLNDQTMDLI